MPKTFSKQEIEELFLKTTGGFYLSKCAENDPKDAKGFYDNQLKQFTDGFECCMEQIEASK